MGRYSIGINKEGDKVNLPIIELPYCDRSYVDASKKDLVSLEIDNSISCLYCYDNSIRELWIPETLTNLICDKDLDLKGNWDRKDLRVEMY